MVTRQRKMVPAHIPTRTPERFTTLQRLGLQPNFLGLGLSLQRIQLRQVLAFSQPSHSRGSGRLLLGRYGT